MSSDLQDVWNDAIKHFKELKDSGKLSEAHWNILNSHASPSELLKFLETAPYKTKEASKLVQLAKSSVHVVERFDKELSALSSGTSNSAFGAPSVAWAGLLFVAHVRYLTSLLVIPD